MRRSLKVYLVWMAVVWKSSVIEGLFARVETVTKLITNER